MKGQIAVVLMVVALFAGAAIGYFGNPTPVRILTKTSTTTVEQSSGEQLCIVTEYHVWSVETVRNNTTVGGTTTQDYPITSFVTTGFPTSTTVTYNGTTTGYLAYWNSTSCYLIPRGIAIGKSECKPSPSRPTRVARPFSCAGVNSCHGHDPRCDRRNEGTRRTGNCGSCHRWIPRFNVLHCLGH